MRTVLRSKLHRATVTQADVDYQGSITIDADLLQAADIAVFERVLVANLANGERFETYAIAGPAGSGVIGLNGAAARLGRVGDLVIIMAFGTVPDAEASSVQPRIVLLDGKNGITELRA